MTDLSGEAEKEQPWSELDCNYRRTGGVCDRPGSKCRMEPSCITDEPLYGWKRRDRFGRFVAEARQ